MGAATPGEDTVPPELTDRPIWFEGIEWAREHDMSDCAATCATCASNEMLLEERGAEIERTTSTGGKHLSADDHARAQKSLDRAQALLTLRNDLLALGDRVRAIANEPSTTQRPRGSRLRKGLKTPQHTYRLPILGTLVEMGGSGTIGDVLECVYGIMKDRFNEHDLAAMPSGPRVPRWRTIGQSS